MSSRTVEISAKREIREGKSTVGHYHEGRRHDGSSQGAEQNLGLGTAWGAEGTFLRGFGAFDGECIFGVARCRGGAWQ